jgi:hypothetical protein
MISLSLQGYARRLHRAITPILVAPIMLTAFTAARHPMLRSHGIDKDPLDHPDSLGQLPCHQSQACLPIAGGDPP